MPCCCYHCCSAVVLLARRILQPTLAPNKAKHGGQRHRPLLSSHSLHHSWIPFKADQPGPGGHPGPPRISLPPVLALRMHGEAGGPGRAATITPDHPTGSSTLSTAHLSSAGHSAVALGKSPWPLQGAGSNLERCMGKACVIQRLSKQLHCKAVLTVMEGAA